MAYVSGYNLDKARRLEKRSNIVFIKQVQNPVMRSSYQFFTREDTIVNKVEKYRFDAGVHAVKKWEGQPDYKVHKEHEIAVNVEDWFWGTTMDETVMRENEQDLATWVGTKIAAGAMQFQKHRQTLFIQRFLNPLGTTFDGESFYSTSHLDDAGGIYSNLITGSGITEANIKADLETIRVNALSLVDAASQPYMRPDDIKMHVYHNSTLEPVFADIFQNPEVPDGAGERNKWFYSEHTHEMVSPEMEGLGNNDYYVGVSKDYMGLERPFYLIWYKQPQLFFPMDDYRNRVSEKYDIVGKGSYDFNVGFPGFFVKVTNA